MRKSIFRRVFGTAAVATVIGIAGITASPLAAHAWTFYRPPAPVKYAPPAYPSISLSYGSPDCFWVNVTGSGFTPGGQVEVSENVYYNGQGSKSSLSIVTASQSGTISTTFYAGATSGTAQVNARNDATGTWSNTASMGLYCIP